MQAKVTSKGQITLPKRVRDSLSIRTGDRLEFALGYPNEIRIRKKKQPGSSVGCAKHLLESSQQPLTVERQDEAIRNRMRKKYGHLVKGV